MTKKILITGSTDGIGKLAAMKLAMDGHHVYLHGRNPEKLDRSISEVNEATGNENVDGFVADFSDLDDVADMASKIAQKMSALDVLINNAGVYHSTRNLTQTGLDMRLVVNYLAPYLLTDRILPMLKEAEEPRVINLSSAAQATVSEMFVTGKQEVSPSSAYAQSKLALTMWSFYLADKERDIVVIPVNPGSLLNTKMVQEAFGKFWSSADKGAHILYDLANSERYQRYSGGYFDNDKGGFAKAHADAYDLTKIEQLIVLTKDVLKDYR